MSATVSSHCEGGTCVADVELLTALDPSTIPELTRLLRKPPWEAKKVIPVYVEDDGKEETVALYIDGAHVGGRVVREAAATALGWIGPQAAPAVPDLVDALEDHDSHNKLRIVAAAALGWIGPEAREAGPALARHLKTDENVTVRVNCAIALGEVDPEAEATISALKAALQDSTKDVRNAAAETLKKLGRTPRSEARRSPHRRPSGIAQLSRPPYTSGPSAIRSEGLLPRGPC